MVNTLSPGPSTRQPTASPARLLLILSGLRQVPRDRKLWKEKVFSPWELPIRKATKKISGNTFVREKAGWENPCPAFSFFLYQLKRRFIYNRRGK
jgi:hypothetical protein